MSDPQDLKITILFDNYVFNDQLTAEWGFSALIEYGDNTILFDAGTDGEILLDNISKLGIDSHTIDALVISHNHADHTGGLQSLLNLGITPPVYLLKSFSSDIKDYVSASTQLVEINDPVEIIHGIYSTGPVPMNVDEEALIIVSKQGLVILTGCAHPEVTRMVNKTNQLIDGNIYFVMGGFHMLNYSDTQIQSVITHFQEHGVQKVMPTHCTGFPAINSFRQAFGNNFLEGGVGQTVIINE
ncbi:MAG: hypothetical protein A2V66_10280 [Ignavibacteria bacterium RBG_13_36_8]|nr:MAG: hypothetical protein A2V66_10280 [Ignavibacteria bacterium RBG_13_36_8]